MENIQFRTNLIEWGKCKEGYICPINAYALKEQAEYNDPIASFIATDLLPNKISYIDIATIDHMLEEYEDNVEDNGDDPIEMHTSGLSDDEIDAARVFYMLIKDVEWSDDERKMTTESIMNAYFNSPDVSKMNKDDLESVFIEPIS